jgi:hypothetical protein
MDEDQGLYQAEEVIEQETQTEAAETVTTQEAAAPEGFTVKYNKEDRFVAKDEAPTWIQKGLNYDKVHERAQQLEAQTKYLEKQAKIYGYATVDEYTKAVDEYEQQQQIQQEAQRIGVDPDTYAQYFAPVNDQLSELQQKVMTYEQQMTQAQQQAQLNETWGELYSQYPGLVETSTAFNEGKNPDWFTQDMQQLVQMGYKPVHAYELAHKNTLFQQKEQETIARLTGRDQKQVLPSRDSPNNVQFDPNNMSDAEIQAISERVRRGERITF